MKRGDIPAVNRILAVEYRRHKAPIVELTRARTNSPFKILLATILSSRTRDETTSQVCDRLFRTVDTPADLERMTVAQIEKLIYPIGFYRTKAQQFKELPTVLRTRFGGRIPDTIDGLCELPGVGRKVANLVVAVAFDKPAVCVDVHVHRICNRLGLLKTGSPFETEMALRRILPRRYWITWNSYLVSYGQTVCRPLNPLCNGCRIYRWCSRIGVRTRHNPVR